MHIKYWSLLFVFVAEINICICRCPRFARKKFPTLRMKYRSRRRFVNFSCRNKDWTLIGRKQLICIDDKWNGEPPICVGTGCPIVDINFAIIESQHDGAYLEVKCERGYELVGESSLHCVRRKWSTAPPFCRYVMPKTSCDFEQEDLCGWVQDTKEDDFDWTRHQGPTPTGETGPGSDHTFQNETGHYMFIETSSPQKSGDVATLLSPVYPQEYSNMCFEFYYHMLQYGDEDYEGELSVYVQSVDESIPEDAEDDDDDVPPVPDFRITGNHGDVWHRGSINIGDRDSNFFIVVTATRGSTFYTDVAIDDVRLYNCSQEPNTTDAGSVMTTSEAPTLTTEMPITTKANVSNFTTEMTISTEINVSNFTTRMAITTVANINSSTDIDYTTDQTPIDNSTKGSELTSISKMPAVAISTEVSTDNNTGTEEKTLSTLNTEATTKEMTTESSTVKMSTKQMVSLSTTTTGSVVTSQRPMTSSESSPPDVSTSGFMGSSTVGRTQQITNKTAITQKRVTSPTTERQTLTTVLLTSKSTVQTPLSTSTSTPAPKLSTSKQSTRSVFPITQMSTVSDKTQSKPSSTQHHDKTMVPNTTLMAPTIKHMPTVTLPVSTSTVPTMSSTQVTKYLKTTILPASLGTKPSTSAKTTNQPIPQTGTTKMTNTTTKPSATTMKTKFSSTLTPSSLPSSSSSSWLPSATQPTSTSVLTSINTEVPITRIDIESQTNTTIQHQNKTDSPTVVQGGQTAPVKPLLIGLGVGIAIGLAIVVLSIFIYFKKKREKGEFEEEMSPITKNACYTEY